KADVSIRLGYSFYNQRNFSFARNEFKSSLEVLHEFSKDTTKSVEYIIQEQLDNIGLTYFNENKFDSAKLYFDSTLKYINNQVANRGKYSQESIEVAKAVVEGNIARIYLEQNKNEAAKSLLRKQYK